MGIEEAGLDETLEALAEEIENLKFSVSKRVNKESWANDRAEMERRLLQDVENMIDRKLGEVIINETHDTATELLARIGQLEKKLDDVIMWVSVHREYHEKKWYEFWK